MLADQRSATPKYAAKGAAKVSMAKPKQDAESYPLSVDDLRSLLTEGEHDCDGMKLTVDTEDPTIQRLAEEIGEPDSEAEEA